MKRGDGEPELLIEGGQIEAEAPLVAPGGDRREQPEVRGPPSREPLCAHDPLDRGKPHNA